MAAAHSELVALRRLGLPLCGRRVGCLGRRFWGRSPLISGGSSPLPLARCIAYFLSSPWTCTHQARRAYQSRLRRLAVGTHPPCYSYVSGHSIVRQDWGLACLLTLLRLRSGLWACSDAPDGLPDCLQEISYLHGLAWRDAQHCTPGIKASCSLLCGGGHALCISLDALHRIMRVDSCFKPKHASLEASKVSIQESQPRGVSRVYSLPPGCGIRLQCNAIRS